MVEDWSTQIVPINVRDLRSIMLDTLLAFYPLTLCMCLLENIHQQIGAKALEVVAAWMASAGMAQFDGTLTSLRVVTVAVNLCCDAFRPSLCLEALTSRNELSEVVTDPGSEKRIRGPFAGGATSWKSGFAYEALRRGERHRISQRQNWQLPGLSKLLHDNLRWTMRTSSPS